MARLDRLTWQVHQDLRWGTLDPEPVLIPVFKPGDQRKSALGFMSGLRHHRSATLRKSNFVKGDDERRRSSHLHRDLVGGD